MSARPRDAARSRAAILEAAEALFAERGFRATTLADIAAAAGLARATPSYFFGTKERLYEQVLVGVQAAREAALRDAFAPVRAWAAEPGADRTALRAAFAAAVAGYFAFLDAHPAFARLIGWEAQAGAERLQAVATHGTAVTDALRALHAVREERGLADFDPALASVALVSLCFLPIAHAATFRAGGGIDTGARAFRGAYADVVVDAAMGIVTG
ncbi:MAG TPA: TetR family transcriptional regulator [Solirubrobacteraceae bacterium]|nr:TetR family transcriptional regulator [Solirubrobacteraceae bacterium]